MGPGDRAYVIDRVHAFYKAVGLHMHGALGLTPALETKQNLNKPLNSSQTTCVRHHTHTPPTRVHTLTHIHTLSSKTEYV